MDPPEWTVKSCLAILMKLLICYLLTLLPIAAKVVDYQLVVAEEWWAPAGMKPVRSLLLNGSLPGPTLRFRVGDFARITVTNQLLKEETSVHWNGLLLPNAQDGVPRLTTPPIPAMRLRIRVPTNLQPSSKAPFAGGISWSISEGFLGPNLLKIKWWRRGESNPCPRRRQHWYLHV